MSHSKHDNSTKQLKHTLSLDNETVERIRWMWTVKDILCFVLLWTHNVCSTVKSVNNANI